MSPQVHQGFEGLVEVGVGGLVVLVLGVEDAGDEVDLGDDAGLAVDVVGVGAGGGEGSLGLRVVPHLVVDLALEEVEFHQQQLVVGLPHLDQDGLDDLAALVRLPHLQVQPRQLQLHPVLQVRPLLPHAPLHQPLAQLDLQLLRTRHLRDVVHQTFRYLRQSRLREDVQSVREAARYRLDALRMALVHVQLGQAVDGCLLGSHVLLHTLDFLLDQSQQLLLAAAAHSRGHSVLVRHFKNNSNPILMT